MYTYTSGYFSIYDDEYRRAHDYDDDEHASHDTQGSADLRTSLQTASSTMMGPGRCEPPGDPRSHTRVVCREVLHIRFVKFGGYPYDGFNDRSLDHELNVFAFSDSNNEVTYTVFLKYSSRVLLQFQVKARHPIQLISSLQFKTMTQA